ncbi:cupin domain-containing protein [Actinocrispum sp. NPDC049592]|uniref:cupin domain-containing protein n=1 Tax=Actinocrispum sp. NPDC049592 TaxID=3154835 RepID=UPI00341F5F5A
MSILPPDADRKRWHLGALTSIAATAAETNGALSVVEQRAQRGFATPAHVHGREDETLFVIDGELEYSVDGVTGIVTAGKAAHLPKGRAHRFAVLSETAHFLVIITPGGFERFFGEVSPSASAERLPNENDGVHTALLKMVESAASCGTKVFHDEENAILTAARTVATSDIPAEITSAYRELGALLAGPGPLPEDPDAAVQLLVEAVGRLESSPVHARALILLGILIERADAEVPVRPLIDAIQPDLPEPAALAFAYALAHFPAHAESVRAALAPVNLPEPDRERFLRCLEEPALQRIGRVWPSPTVWRLDEAEQGLDESWRTRLDLSEEAVRELWDAETVALLAFMGSRADHAVERTEHA